jgi:site-specific recombinase XerD
MNRIDKERGFFHYIHDYLKVYLPNMRVSSPNTITSYRTALNLIIDYMEQVRGIDAARLRVDDLSVDTVAAFLGWLHSGGRSPATCNLRLSGVKSFVSYCALCDSSYIPLNAALGKVRPIRVSGKPLEVMSEEAFAAILTAIDTTTKNGVRDHLIIVLLFETGIRVQELVDIKVGDVCIEVECATITVTGKGRKTRTVLAQKRVAEYLRSYYDARRQSYLMTADSYFFYTIRNCEPTKMSVDTPQKFIKRYADKARESCPEIPRSVHPHSFRHLRATSLYRRGVPLSIIGKLLGHASVDTTQIYATADIEMMRAAIEASGPVAGMDAISMTIPEGDSAMLRRLSGLQ